MFRRDTKYMAPPPFTCAKHATPFLPFMLCLVYMFHAHEHNMCHICRLCHVGARQILIVLMEDIFLWHER